MNQSAGDWLKKIAIVIFSLLIGLLVMEFLVRFYELSVERPSPYFSSDSDYPQKYFSASDLGFQPVPGVHKATKYDSRHNLIYDINYTIGKDRFRVTPNSSNKKNKLSINFFGCSFMIGEGVNDLDTIPAKFGILAPQYNLKNYGSHGFGAHQALRILTGLPYSQEKNTINFFQTAAWHADRVVCKRGESAPGNPVFSISPDGQIFYFGNCRSVWEDDISTKNLVQGILLDTDKPYKIRLLHYLKPLMSRFQRDSYIKLYINTIEEMSSISKSRNQVFIVGYIRDNLRFLRGTNWSDDKIISELRRKNINVIDLSLNNQTPTRLLLSNEDGHPSPYANELRANLIHEYIKDIAWDAIPPSRH